MSKYGEVAVQAAKLVFSGSEPDPEKAWSISTAKIFPTSKSLQNKGCPKGAFLGLCNLGLVNGIPGGSYSRSSKNGKYAAEAVSFLEGNKFLASQPELLWKKVSGNTISENHQMDVVIGLWDAGYIGRE